MIAGLLLALLPQFGTWTLAATTTIPNIGAGLGFASYPSRVCIDDSGRVWLAGRNLDPNTPPNGPMLAVVALDLNTLAEIPGTRWYSWGGFMYGEHHIDVVCTTTNSVFVAYQDSLDGFTFAKLSDHGQLTLDPAPFPSGGIDGLHPHLAAARNGNYAFITELTSGGLDSEVAILGDNPGPVTYMPNPDPVAFPVWVAPDICQTANGRYVSSFGWFTPNLQPLTIYAPPMAVSLAADSRGLVIGLLPNGKLQAWAQNGYLLGGPQLLIWLGGSWNPWSFTGHSVVLSDRDGGVVSAGGSAQSINARGKLVDNPWHMAGESLWISRDGHTLIGCSGSVVEKWVR